MPEQILIPVAKLEIDIQNPRLTQDDATQREALREIAQHQQSRLVKLAEDIVNHKLSPSELPMVIKSKARYVMLDGNRRLAAIRGLENPQWMVGALNAKLLPTMRTLSRQYLKDPIKEIRCLLFTDREESIHWLDIRHGGQMEGAGVVRWGADERARFLARNKPPEVHIQALNFLQDKGYMTTEERRKVPVASYKRMLGTPEIRDKAGITLEKGVMNVVGEEKKVAGALIHIADDLVSGKIKTKDIYERDQRVGYANLFPKAKVAMPIRQSAKPSASTATVAARPSVYKPTRPRDTLIPTGCVLNISPSRLNEIEGELHTLSLENFSNAVTALFRVFIELSCDAYIEDVGLTTSSRQKELSNKLEAIVNDLRTRRRLTDAEAQPVRRALQRDSFLVPSVREMQEWMHNRHSFPPPGDLRRYWDSLEPFFKALWSVHAEHKKTLASKKTK